MHIIFAFAEGVVELVSIAAFVTVVIGWLAGAAGHLPL